LEQVSPCSGLNLKQEILGAVLALLFKDASGVSYDALRFHRAGITRRHPNIASGWWANHAPITTRFDGAAETLKDFLPDVAETFKV
jgi:hypothetical protein